MNHGKRRAFGSMGVIWKSVVANEDEHQERYCCLVMLLLVELLHTGRPPPPPFSGIRSCSPFHEKKDVRIFGVTDWGTNHLLLLSCDR